jgi:hypothetical protein
VVSGTGTAEPGRLAGAPISFAVPVKPAPASVHYIKLGQSGTTGCTGTAEAPGAEPGNLCVFATIESTPHAAEKAIENPEGAAGASPFGAILTFEATESSPEANINARGTWAVTAAG